MDESNCKETQGKGDCVTRGKLFFLLDKLTDKIHGQMTLCVIPPAGAQHLHTVLVAVGVTRLPLLPVAVVLQWRVVCEHILPLPLKVIHPNEDSEEATLGDIVSDKSVNDFILGHG